MSIISGFQHSLIFWFKNQRKLKGCPILTFDLPNLMQSRVKVHFLPDSQLNQAIHLIYKSVLSDLERKELQ